MPVDRPYAAVSGSPSARVYYQYSVDGTSWHDTYATSDTRYRFATAAAKPADGASDWGPSIPTSFTPSNAAAWAVDGNTDTIPDAKYPARLQADGDVLTAACYTNLVNSLVDIPHRPGDAVRGALHRGFDRYGGLQYDRQYGALSDEYMRHGGTQYRINAVFQNTTSPYAITLGVDGENYTAPALGYLQIGSWRGAVADAAKIIHSPTVSPLTHTYYRWASAPAGTLSTMAALAVVPVRIAGAISYEELADRLLPPGAASNDGQRIAYDADGKPVIVAAPGAYTADVLWEAGPDQGSRLTTNSATTSYELLTGKKFSDYSLLAIDYDHNSYAATCGTVMMVRDSWILRGTHEGWTDSHWVHVQYVDDTHFRKTSGAIGLRRIWGVKNL